jgi:hypothetical protein
VVNCRLLCGDEREALRQSFYDHNLTPTKNVAEIVRCEVELIWRGHQKEAGVNPKYYA